MEEEDYDPEYAPRSESPDEEDYTVRMNDEEDDGGRKRRGPPPPLTVPSRDNSDSLIAAGEPSPLPSADSVGSRGRVKLPYRESDEEDDGSEESRERRRRRKVAGGDRRTGVYFDELDLGLEFDDTVEVRCYTEDEGTTAEHCCFEQYDENDPYDKRRSQFLMKARLDELEKVCIFISGMTIAKFVCRTLRLSHRADLSMKMSRRSTLHRHPH